MARAACAAALLIAVRAAHSDGADPSPFVGTWIFQSDSAARVDLDCASPDGSHSALSSSDPLVGSPASIHLDPTGAADLIFELGCSCRIALHVEGSTASLVGPPQLCQLVSKGYLTTGHVRSLSRTP